MAADQNPARLSESQALALLRLDLHELGRQADALRRQRHGHNAYYVINRHIHYSNLCLLRCKVCSFARSQGQDGAYERSIDQIALQVADAVRGGASEIHLTGGLHPEWRIDHYERMLRSIRSVSPTVHIKAFTACEIHHVAALSGMPAEAVLDRLIAAGLNSLPGGGAEILVDSIRQRLFPGKISSSQWLEIHRLAHGRGLKTNATMLYGHGEKPEDRIRHLMLLRQLQDETGGFQAFVPLAFIPPAGGGFAPGPGGIDDLRTIALSRLVLDNIPHIKTFWVMHSLALSSVALHFGADDIDGTVVSYDIVPPSHGHVGEGVSQAQLQAVIRKSGFEPVLRDGRSSAASV